jgi:hypothetical protein
MVVHFITFLYSFFYRLFTLFTVIDQLQRRVQELEKKVEEFEQNSSRRYESRRTEEASTSNRKEQLLEGRKKAKQWYEQQLKKK